MPAELSQNRRRLLGRLRARKQREREGAVLVEGLRAVSEAVAAGARLRFAVTSPRLLSTDSGRALAGELNAVADVTEVGDDELAALSDTEQPQGVLAVAEQPAVPLAELPGQGVLLLLDAVQDPGNVGTLVRSAVAFGLGGVVCLDGTTDPWGAKTVRASAGTVFRLPVWSVRLDEIVSALDDRGAGIAVADAGGAPVDGALARRPELLALVLGNEGAGVRPELRERAQAVVAVPMRGPAESLNVAVAGSILMYECTRSLEIR